MNPFFAQLMSGSLYKLGYVTRDRDAALEQLRLAYPGIEFVLFEPSTPGDPEPTALRCAFVKASPHVIEVMQPVSGAVALWADRIPAGAEPGALHFHHIGTVVADFDATLAAAAANGIEPVEVTEHAGVLRGAYFALPGLGHYLECVQYLTPSQGFLEQARGAVAAR